MIYIESFFGWLLYNKKAGDSALVLNRDEYKNIPETIEVTSDEFKEGEHWPLETAGEGVGENKCPSLHIKCENPKVSSIVLILQDIDVPFVAITHLCAYDIKPVANFKLGDFKLTSTGDSEYRAGKGAFGTTGYIGPRPIINHGPHRYIFQVFGINEAATKKLREFQDPQTLKTVLEIILGNIIVTGKLGGHYQRD